MLRRLTDQISKSIDYLKACFKSENLFEANNQREISDQQVLRALKFALSSNATDYRSFHEVQYFLRVLTTFFIKGQENKDVQQLLVMEQEALWTTPKLVLYMLQKYLEHVMPTNITYYHFMRQKQFYSQWEAIRYILVIGLHSLPHGSHIFLRIKTNQKLKIFTLLLDWLLSLIYYRCSAIYVHSNCVQPLAFISNLLLSGLLGHDHHSIFSSLEQSQLENIFNKMLYIQGFLLCLAIKTQNQLEIQMILNTLRKLLTSTHHQKISMYLPSYLYANFIGFIQVPLTTQIIYRLLIFFISHLRESPSAESENSLSYEKDDKSQLITQCWSIVYLLLQQYDLDRNVCQQLIGMELSRVENRSIDRAFILRIAKNLHFDLDNESISSLIKKRKQPYVVGNKVLKPELVVKNYSISMQKYHLKIIYNSSKGEKTKIDLTQLWEDLTNYNKYEISTLDQYLYQLNARSQKLT